VQKINKNATDTKELDNRQAGYGWRRANIFTGRLCLYIDVVTRPPLPVTMVIKVCWFFHQSHLPSTWQYCDWWAFWFFKFQVLIGWSRPGANRCLCSECSTASDWLKILVFPNKLTDYQGSKVTTHLHKLCWPNATIWIYSKVFNIEKIFGKVHVEKSKWTVRFQHHRHPRVSKNFPLLREYFPLSN
jgi:hypothetical protein